ncbi:hypothetical protein ACH5RR_040343 [Cinchona calisaya]|uniref:Uncharacterized protein n=1 Tax=Cinchona calisaya TaxID=153742 RepID=A0ABD2XST2_9GENT
MLGQIREKLSQIPATEQTSVVKQRIFKEVMGSKCRGYVRTVGSDPSPAQYFGETSSKNQLSNNYMTMILNKIEELYEQKYGGKISDMQSQIDALNARLQSGGSTVVGTPPMAYTQGGNQLPVASREDHQNKNLPQDVNSGDLGGFALDEVSSIINVTNAFN